VITNTLYLVVMRKSLVIEFDYCNRWVWCHCLYQLLSIIKMIIII